MLRLRFCSIFLLTFINSVILVLAEGPNWSKIVLNSIDILEVGPEVGEGTILEVNDANKAVGVVNLTLAIDAKTTLKWRALYLNPDDNQYNVQAESEPTGICDFLVFQAPVAQMFFENSNMTACPFQKGYYVFRGSGPNKEAFPQRIPKGRDTWQVEVLAVKVNPGAASEMVAHIVINALLER